MRKRLDGFPLIILSTAITGIAGYVVTWLAYREIGPEGYALFAVFWATLYLIVGGLSGIQQEITRATRSIEAGTRERASKARGFAISASAVVFLLVIGTAVFWSSSVFPNHGWLLVWPLAVGAASYVFSATLAGSLYGVLQWRSLSLVIAADGLLRLLLLGVTLSVTHDIVVIAWIVALPFPLSVLLLWPLIRRRFVGRSDIDVGYRALTWNVARTVLAAVSTAVLVSGFPLLLGTTARRVDQALVGELIFTITLTRAPLIVTVMALQSYFLVRFRDRPDRWRSLFLVALGIVVAGAAVIAALGWWLGPVVLGWVSGSTLSIDGSLIAALVVSSALVAALCLTAPAVLAKSQHFVYSLGWGAAAIVTIIVMVSPLDFLPKVVLALLLGPIAGLVVHVSWLVFHAISHNTRSTA